MSEALFFPVLLSFQVALTSTILVIPLAIGIAWVLAKSGVPGKSALDALVNLPLVLPPVVTGFLLLLLLGSEGPLGGFLESRLGIRIVFTWWAAVAASTIVSLPLAVRAIVTAMQALDADLEWTARTLGASEWRVFFEVTLPLSARGVIAGAVLAFARSLGEFGATIVVASSIPGKTETIPLAIFRAITVGDDPRAIALAGVAAVIAFVALWISHRMTLGRSP